jgi:hypothetical protein
MNKKMLSLSVDIPNLVIAIFLSRETERNQLSKKKVKEHIKNGKLTSYSEISLDGKTKAEKKIITQGKKNEQHRNDDIFAYSFLSIQYEEWRIISILTSFLDKGLIEKIIVTKYKALNAIDRKLTEVREISKIKKESAFGFESPVPFIENHELVAASENEEYWEYKIKVHNEKLKEHIDEHLILWKNNQYSHSAIKQEKQLSNTKKYIEEKLEDFNPENIWIKEFEDSRIFDFPAVVLELENQEFLEISKNNDFLRVDKEGLLHFQVNILPEKSKNQKKYTEFDTNKSILKIYDHSIPIRKLSNQYHLLNVIFSESTKDWQYSEIAEIIDKTVEWKSWYNVADAIKKKIAINTKGEIQDFFITTTQSVQTNPEYL